MSLKLIEKTLRPRRPELRLALLLLTLASHCSSSQSQEVGTEPARSVPTSSSPASAGPVDDGGWLKVDSGSSGRIVVIAPKFLRPLSDYHVLINLVNSQVPATIDLQLIGARDSDREQVEAKSVLVSPNETQTVKFDVGPWPRAEYVLNVSAQAVDRSWDFKDEKPLTYQAKSFSAFIQTDKAIYKPGQLVQFRALFLTPSLTPLVLKDQINVTVEDPQRNTIRQWQHLSNYRGLLSLEMPLSDDPMLGDYSIKLEAKGQEFGKQFTVAEYVLPTFNVAIQTPSYAIYSKPNIVVTTRASYTYGKPVSGHVTLTMQPLARFSVFDTRPLGETQYRARLSAEGTADFQVNLVTELRDPADMFEREVQFFALVEEDLTGRKYNATQTLKVYADKIKIESLHQKEGGLLRPGLPKLMRYKVSYQDDTPVENNGPDVTLKYMVRGETIQLEHLQPKNGLIEHQLEIPAKLVDPRTDSFVAAPRIVNLQIAYRNRPHNLEPLRVQQTDSNEYLQIYLPQLLQRSPRAAGTQAISVNDELRVRVLSTEPMQQVTCQGFSKGDIVWALSKQVDNKTELEFDIRVEPRMAPRSRVLCFYIRPANKELIADSVSVAVANGLVRNLVKLTASRNEAKPGQEVEVGVFTKPNSLVGVLAVDQSVLLLKSGNDLSQKEITNDLASYGASGDTNAPADPNTAGLLEAADVVVLTDSLVYQGAGRRFGTMLAGSPFAVTPWRDGSSSSNIALDSLILDHPLQPPEFHLAKRERDVEIRIRSLFPETWLWQNGTADSSGQVRFSSRAPDTITSWEITAFSMNEAHGLALTADPTTVRVFRPFFIKLNLPYSIIRGETVAIQAVVFNYSPRPVTARVTLDNRRGEIEFAEPANTVGDERQLESNSSESRTVQVAAQGGASVSFLVRPTKLGPVEIRMRAQADRFGDGVVRTLLVKPEGQTQHFNKAVLVQLAEPQSSWRQNFSIAVPANAVPDSQQVRVSAIGDILGAGLSNVDDLLRLPYGCGEQNMVNLVPNIVILNYLRSTGRLHDFQRERATRNIQVGYQRQLNYKRPDGSFSAFGPADANGSVWLTAYVLKTLRQAARVVTVDARVLGEAASFLAAHSRPDGSLEEVGMLHNRDLASKSLGVDGSARPIYLTAYTLVALLQEPRADGPAGQVLEKGLDYLEQQLALGELSAYELSIIAYTLELAGGRRQNSADRAYEMLWARAIARQDEDQVHWSNGPSSTEPTEAPAGDSAGPAAAAVDERVAGRVPRGVAKQEQPPLKEFGVRDDQSAHLFVPDSLDVEMTSWALLTSVKREELERALPVVRWLVARQNSLGGFASTQDTVLAIEALAAYAEASARSASNAGQSIEVEFVYPRAAAGSGGLRRHGLEQVLVSRTNALVQQRSRLPDNVTWVQVQASGTGSVVVQVSWQYNLLVSAERPAFYLNPTLDADSTADYLRLSVCASYTGAGEASNMALAEVELPSGYVADTEALASLRRHAQIKRTETADGETRVLVYLDRVGRDELCFSVPAHRSSRVANSKPVPVTIYDYYRRDQAARVFYRPPAAGPCDLCERGSCGDSCSGAPAGAREPDRPASLHDQRRRLAQAVPARPSGDQAKRANLIDASQPAAANASSGPFDAFKLLPLSAAFSALNQAAKNASLHL